MFSFSDMKDSALNLELLCSLSSSSVIVTAKKPYLVARNGAILAFCSAPVGFVIAVITGSLAFSVYGLVLVFAGAIMMVASLIKNAPDHPFGRSKRR